MSKQWLGNLYGFCLFWWVLFVCFYIISLDKDLLEQASNSGFFYYLFFFQIVVMYFTEKSRRRGCEDVNRQIFREFWVGNVTSYPTRALEYI